MQIEKNTRRAMLFASTATMFSTGFAFFFLAIALAFASAVWGITSFTGADDGISLATPIILLGATAIPAVVILAGLMSIGVANVASRAALSGEKRKPASIALAVCAVAAYPMAATIALLVSNNAATVLAVPAILVLVTSPWWAPLSVSGQLPARTMTLLGCTAATSAVLAVLVELAL